MILNELFCAEEVMNERFESIRVLLLTWFLVINVSDFAENEPMNRSKEGEKGSLKEDSKWSQYVTREDCDGIAGDDWKSLTNEEKVGDEEIHPDFL